MKRFNVTGITRDREVDLTQGNPGTRVLYFTANPNGEAEVIKVQFDASVQAAHPRMNMFLERSFADIEIKGRASKGNLLTKFAVHRITLKSQGHSTLGGRKVWFDPDVKRLNYDEHGQLLGEFFDDEQILVVLDNGDYYLTNFDLNNHYDENILLIEKYKAEKVWTAVLFDADNQGYPYMKRFMMDATKRKQNLMGDNPTSKLVLLTDTVYPIIKVTYGGADEYRGSEEIDAEQFIAVKGYKAKGKRITTWQTESIEELPPTRLPEEEEESLEDSEEPVAPEDSEEPEVLESLIAPEEAEESEEPEEAEESEQSETTEAPEAPKAPSTQKYSDVHIIDEKTGQLSFDF